jgi:hypothetical protein
MPLGRAGDWVHGEFEVLRVEPYDLDSGIRTDTVTGQLLVDGRRTTVVSVNHTTQASTPPPSPGTRRPARWQRDRPERVKLDWGNEGVLAHGARIERDRRAAALGIDPTTLSADPVPAGTSALDALMMWTHNGALLPDGTSPVFTEEADRIKSMGRAAEAVIAAIDYLKPLPGTAPSGASVANVALEIATAEGDNYRVLARFGFRTAERRGQIGHVGARVPVRIDPADRTRVTLDSARLPVTGGRRTRGTPSR